jgi:prevent-host-death family protein
MKTKKAGVFEVKAHLSEILKEVEQGTTYLVTNRGREVAELRPCRDNRPHPKAGFAKGTVVRIADDFDEPLEDFRDYMK